MIFPTNITHLDNAIGGGIPTGSAVLVHGPAASGKELLAARTFVVGVAQGAPGVIVTTRQTATDMASEMTRLEPEFPSWLKEGRVRMVDAYSHILGVEEGPEATIFVDGSGDLNGILEALDTAQAELVSASSQHMLMMDSVSTTTLFADQQRVGQFMQVVVGRARRSGATSLFLVDDAMHDEQELARMRHLMTGSIQLREYHSNSYMTANGMNMSKPIGWAEYAVTETGIEVTGLFSEERIA